MYIYICMYDGHGQFLFCFDLSVDDAIVDITMMLLYVKMSDKSFSC